MGAPEREIASLIEEAKSLEDATGAFDALYQYGWDLLLIPFSPSVAASVPQEKKEAGAASKLCAMEAIPEEILAAIARSLDIPISEVTPAALKSLTYLDLSNTKVSDVTALKSLTSLQSLDLSGTQVSDVTALKSLTSLQSLDLHDTQVSEVTALKSLTSLQSLYLSYTQVSDLTALQGLTNLQALHFDDTPVSDVIALQSLTKLRSLSLGETQVSDVTALQCFTSLEGLYLENTRVSDVTALYALKDSLKILWLYNTPAARNETTMAALREALPNTGINS